MIHSYRKTDVLTFWFSEPMKSHWFSSTPAIDKAILADYKSLWQHAKQHKLSAWEQSPDGCLALCIVLDQFPLNMFRGEAKSFSTEQQAVNVAKKAIRAGFDEALPQHRVSFLYMPLMHSEHLDDQDLALKCFEKTNLEGNIAFAKHHRGIVERFGRFPHRNKILGRQSTQAELDYLASDKAFTG